MDKETVKLINDSPFKVFLAITGGGQSFIGDYCKISGASKTIVGAIVPYDRTVFDKFVKNSPIESYASIEAARKLAVHSYLECLAATPKEHALGIGVSCSLATDGERKDRTHKINIALHGYNFTKTVKATLIQGRTRDYEEKIVSFLIFRLLSNFVLKRKERLDLFVDSITEDEVYASNDLLQVIDNKYDIITGTIPSDDTLVIYSGSWNPWHEGHTKLKELAEQILGKPVIVELNVFNPDKGPLDFIDIRDRRQYISGFTNIITNAPTYYDKIGKFKSLFPNKKLIFVVGADTWNRVWSADYAKYYSLQELANRCEFDVKFLVFGRANETIRIKNAFNKRFLIENETAQSLNMSYSSKEIRKQHAKSF